MKKVTPKILVSVTDEHLETSGLRGQEAMTGKVPEATEKASQQVGTNWQKLAVEFAMFGKK